MKHLPLQKLINYAKDMQQKAYAPYSKFYVGAAVQTNCGKIFGGCNIESASYGLTVCAERVALFHAIAQGYNSFTHLAIVTNTGSSPCGACRQVMHELCPTSSVIIASPTSIVLQTSVDKLLPNAFDIPL